MSIFSNICNVNGFESININASQRQESLFANLKNDNKRQKKCVLTSSREILIIHSSALLGTPGCRVLIARKEGESTGRETMSSETKRA